MEILQVTKDNALQAYKEADDKGKTLITTLFGKRHFLLNVIDRVKSFEDACQETGDDPMDPFFSSGRPHENALRQMEVIVKALNEGTTLSFKNADQRKWYAWLVYEGTGFRFYATYSANASTYPGLGSRLCLHSQELARYFGTQFIDLLNQYLKQEHEN